MLIASREDDFEAQMSPFDFLRQEMLRPFEGKCAASTFMHCVPPIDRELTLDCATAIGFFGGSLFGGGDSNLFEGMEREFERTPFEQPPMPRRHATQPPPSPPHYSFQPSQGKKASGES